MLAAGVDGVVIASSTATHPDLIRACVRAGIPTFCEKPVAAARQGGRRPGRGARRQRRPGADRLPAPLRPGLRRRPATTCSPGGSATCTRSAPRRSTPHLRRRPTSAAPAASSTTARSTTSTPIRWATGQEVVEVYAVGSTQGVDYIAEAGDAETVDVGAHAQRRHHRRGLQHPVQRPRARRTSRAARQRGLRGRRARRAAAAAVGRPDGDLPRAGPRGTSSWTGSPTPSAPS